MFGGMVGVQEIILLLLLVLILFGAKRIPEIMRGFGEGLREFKQVGKDIETGLSEIERTAEEAVK